LKEILTTLIIIMPPYPTEGKSDSLATGGLASSGPVDIDMASQLASDDAAPSQFASEADDIEAAKAEEPTDLSAKQDRSKSVLHTSTDPFATREGKALVWTKVNMTLVRFTYSPEHESVNKQT
jgi:hypothetical protein